MTVPYQDALKIALANSGGADPSTISSWAGALRDADGALDGAIASAFRAGDFGKARDIAGSGSELRACADFLEKLYTEMERS